MRLSDDRVFEAIRKLIPACNGQISYEAIAKEVGCHKNTAINAARRLASAGRIELEGGKGRRPVSYRLKETDGYK